MEDKFPATRHYVYGPQPYQTAYPMAHRHLWELWFYPQGRNRPVDRKAVPHMDGIIIVYVDGHAKWMNVNEFLAKSPPAQDFIPSPLSAFPGGMAWTVSQPMQWRGDWPLWGLYREMATLQ